MKKKEIWIIKKNTGFIHYLNDIHSTYVYNKFFELLVIKNWKYNFTTGNIN